MDNIILAWAISTTDIPMHLLEVFIETVKNDNEKKEN